MKTVLIHNPAAGQRDVHREVQQVADMLAQHGWQVAIRQTAAPGDGLRLAAGAAREGNDLVVAVGGDGTLGEVAAGLAGSGCILGVLPVGTGNVWARNLRIPHWTPSSRTALLDAAQVLLEGEVRAVDLGRVGRRHFILHLGIGFDALVTQAVEPVRPRAARSLRNLRYYAAVLGLAFSRRGTRMTITIDGVTTRERALAVIATNAQFYAGTFRLAPGALLDDGLLDVFVFKGNDAVDALRHMGAVILGRHVGMLKMEAYQVKELTVRSDLALPVQLDGEPVERTPVEVRVEPGALRVIVPPAATDLFCRPPLEQSLARSRAG
ncbi:MAG: diacylglycerol kinase family lipid kinase [Chloroflexi bacterium]|jgi:diacylglycerol kinase (ATP)|nr:diacylglycerol kinase family lipid kinase [Chloroflexota bacterium]